MFDLIGNNSLLFHAMTWKLRDAKTLPEPIMIAFTEAYVWYLTVLGLILTWINFNPTMNK